MPNNNDIEGNPTLIIILSGKRKSGKDYIAELLYEKFTPELSCIVRLSGPLKQRYAAEHTLDYKKLLDSSEYKEMHRKEMIIWGEEIRNRDPEYFCRKAISLSSVIYKQIWIVSDARRKSDIEFFQTYFPDITQTVRINVSDEVRRKRNWVFVAGIDDIESECGLDDYDKWNFQLSNNNPEELNEGIDHIVNLLNCNKMLGNLTI